MWIYSFRDVATSSYQDDRLLWKEGYVVFQVRTGYIIFVVSVIVFS